ncbi:MAG TPA: hypothetical protein DC063_09895 [Arenimonas sp.]|nr:MAG: hypothetical protein A2X76_08965 [Xanthomonadales bacterium GWF1_69_6]HBD20350.1 hypothetical protein [Arenimonas sp.]
MNPKARRRAQLAMAVSLSLAAAGAQGRPAQDPTEPQAEAWQDNVISPDDLEPLPPDETESFDASGLPRSFRFELLGSRTQRADETFSELGLAAGGFRETANYGTFSLDATLQRSDRRETESGNGGDFGGKLTLWQRGLHAGEGWLGSNGLGVLNTPAPELLRQQYRFFLPSVAFAGASTDWVRDRGELVLQGSLGRAGVFDGARVVGFDLADGNVGSASAQWRWSDRWRGAVSLLATDGQVLPDEQGGTFFQDVETRAMHAAAGWDAGGRSINFNLQASDGDLGGAWGGWLDGRLERGRYIHNYGVFRLEPGLGWGAQPINNDSQGAYYRLAYRHARWNWNAGVDRIASVSGDSFDGWYGTAYARYQATSTVGLGGNAALRQTNGADALSGQAFVDRRNAWGQARAQIEVARRSGGRDDDSWQLTLDQSLALGQGRRLTLSAGYGELAYDGEPATGTATLAAYGGFDLTERLTLDGTARWTEGNGPGAFRGADLNLNLAWRVASRWWLVATVYENRGSRRSPFVIDPLATEQPFVNLPRDRTVFLSLRYERQAGTTAGVLGGTPDSASGAIQGSVFLDENGDGIRAASEEAAANVTVILDGRYSVRTDSQGNFEFPRVAVGAHTIEVVPDNLPLPWFLDEQGDRRAVEVQVREAARVDIGARRQR